MAIITKTDTHFENILASFLEPESVELSPFEDEMKSRIKTAFSLMLNWKGREQAVKILCDQYDISQATAYRDVARALKIYGDVTQASKEGMRYILIEYNQKVLQLAMKDKNLDVAGRCLDRMIKLADLDKEDSDVNLEKLKAMDINITISATSEKALDKLASTGVVDLNDFKVEDIDHEEIMPDNAE